MTTPGTDAHLAFALALFTRMTAPGAPGVCSPWSVSSALAVLAHGGDDETRREVVDALSSSALPDHDLLGTLLASARAVAQRPPTDETTLSVTTTLWVDESSEPSPSFTVALSEWPGASVRTAPIATDPDATRDLVNADVADTTRGLVPDALPAGALTPQDRSVLVNALYLLAAWTEPFDAASTTDEPFRTAAGARAVPTMRGVRETSYASQDGWRYVVLPLGRGGGLQVEVLLPAEDGSAPGSPDERPPASPDADTVAALRAAATAHRVTLHLPRFRLEGGGGLVEPLRALGVRRLFDESCAPLPHVVDDGPLAVSQAVHRVVLRLDERGVEGAASTALVMRPVAFRELPTVELRVDRPFHVLVTHRETGAVLFLGRVTDPGPVRLPR